MIVFHITLLLIIACGTQSMPKAVKPYEVQWGTSGGFTGGGEGYIIYPDGTVARWKKATAAAAMKTEMVGRLSPEVCLSICRIIEEKRVLQIKQTETGNMTTVLTLRRDGNDHHFSWPAESGKTPSAIAPLMEKLQTAIADLKK